MKIHPLLRLVATQPHLIAEHAQAYGNLLGEEFGRTTSVWKLRAILVAAAGVLIGVGVIFAGVALMLWAVIVPSSMPAPWALVVVPAVPIVAGAVCLLIARRPQAAPFEDLKQQVAADMALLREAGAT